jgi:tetratricopeptide (TPR) repeat protein
LGQSTIRRKFCRPEILAGLAILCAVSKSTSQTNLERPIALILSPGLEKRSAGEEGWHRAGPGVELFRGDALRYAGGPATFAYCSAAEDGTSGSVQVLNGGATVEFTSQGGIVPPTGSSTSIRLPLCLLPLMERVPITSTQDDPDTRASLSGTLETRLQNLPADARANMIAKLLLADSMIQQADLALLGRTSRAALLESAGLDRDALDLYRAIRDSTADANWTARVIERLTRAQLSRGAPAWNSSITIPFSGAPRVVGDPNALRLPGSELNSEKGQAYALVIGISTYNPLSGVTNLKYADRDALSFREYLKSPRGGGLPDDHIWLLLNEEATRDKLDYDLTEFAKGKAGPDNTLIVFIASHGAYACKRQDLTYEICEPGDDNEEAVILVRESDPQNPKLTGFPMARLRSLLTQRASDFGRVVLYIDACHSGNVRDPPPGGVALPASKAVKALQSSAGELGIMMASSVEDGQRNRELAYEDNNLRHGIFSYFVLNGLNGEAESLAGSVFFDQLYNYVSQKVTAFTSVKQAPDRFRSRSTLKVVDHAAIEGTKILDPAPATTGELASRSADQPEADAHFLQALALHHLLPPEPGNASDALDQLRRAGGENSALYQLRAGQLRVALEEQGQLTILKYLQGDQVTQNEADFQRGATYFRRALDLAPDAAFDRSRLRFCEGRALIFQKDYVRAAELLEQAIHLDPGHSYAHNALGIAYLEQVPSNGDFFQPAVAAFRDAIRLSPYWAYPRHNLGLTLTQRGAYAEAEAQYGAAMRVAPRYSYLPYNAGLLQQQLNRIDEARAYYKKAVKIAEGRCGDRLGATFTVCPERSPPLTALASVTGRRGNALHLFRAAVRDDPTDVTARHDLAVFLSRSKSGKPEAESLWKAILAAQPSYLPALLAYSDFLKSEHRYAESIPFYRTILTQRSDYLPASIDLATALTMTGHPTESLEMVDRLLQANQQNPGLWTAKAQALEAIGDKQKAAEARRAARNLKKRS